MGVYREDYYLHVFPTIVFSFSIGSLHYCSLFLMVVMLILYTSPKFAENCEQSANVFVINVDDEKASILNFQIYNSSKSQDWEGNGVLYIQLAT